MTRPTIRSLRLAQLIVPNDVELDYELVGRLANSIRAHGLITPLEVVRSHHRNRYVIVNGIKRYHALRLLNLTEAIACLITPGR